MHGFPRVRYDDDVRLACVWLALFGCSFSANLPAEMQGDDGLPPDAPPEAITMCAPNTSMCIGRQRVTCNASGTGLDPSLSVVCPLACTGAGQCVAATNMPDATQRACPSTAPALAPPANATVQFVASPTGGNVDITCMPSCSGGSTTRISSTRITQSGGQPAIAMFCLRTIDIPTSVGITYDPAVANPIALLVAGNVQIAGRILLSGSAASASFAGQGGPSGGDGGGRTGDDAAGAPGTGPCPGNGGLVNGSNASAAGGGGGGGGHAASGGPGGQGRSDSSTANGGSGGGTCGNAQLSPIAGGGGGGAGADGSCHPGECGWPGGGGGGAIQISATMGITVASTGEIRASGGRGYGSTNGEEGQGGGGGGGAGGAILLEAPSVTVNGIVDVVGGAGGVSHAGSGGAGGVTMLGGAAGSSQNANHEGGAGGGGAAGRIRIHAAAPSCGSSAMPSAACTTGPLRTVP